MRESASKRFFYAQKGVQRHPASPCLTPCLPPGAPAAQKEAQRDVLKRPTRPKNAHNAQGTPPQSATTLSKKQAKSSRKVTEACASAQRAKLDAQAEERRRQADDAARAKPSPGKRKRAQAGNRRAATIERAIADYLLDHAGGNHSAKTLEWHHTALTLMRAYLEEECKITLVEDIDAPELNGWLTHLRKTPIGEILICSLVYSSVSHQCGRAAIPPSLQVFRLYKSGTRSNRRDNCNI